MSFVDAVEIFAFVTGIAYVVLEILQKNAMWVVGVLTGAACAASFAIQHSWGMASLNVYYVVVSFIGLARWRKDKGKVTEGKLHLRKLPLGTALWSAAVFVFGSLLFIFILRALGDGVSELDAVASVLSVIATWWLTRSYPQQWILWWVADSLTTILCIVSGQYLLAVLYLAYTASAVYGWSHWIKKGETI